MTDVGNSGAFCPRCGAAVDDPLGDRPGVAGRSEGLCDECYLSEFDLVSAPEELRIAICTQCGAVDRGDGWEDVQTEYTELAIEEVADALAVNVDASDVAWQVEPEHVDQNILKVHCYFSGTLRDRPIEEDVTVRVVIDRESCQRCGRIAGDYFAGIVQVRAAGRDPTTEEVDRSTEIAHEVVDEMAATGNRDAFVTEVSEVSEGVDVKVSTNKIGRKVADRIVAEFGGTVSASETLVTEDEDGNEVYRVTFAVRLPRYRPGEVIDPADDEGPVLVRSARGNLKGVRLTTGERYEATSEEGDAPEARRLGVLEDATEATLVAVEDENAVQVLDPETYRATTIPRPTFLDPDAETVPVLRSRAGLHALPPEAVDG